MFHSSIPRVRAAAHALVRRIPARRVGGIAAHVVTVLLIMSVPAAAYADTTMPTVLAVNDLPTVVANLQAWVMGLLAGLATLFLVLAGLYWATAGGDPV